jgi:hypothetical protein
VDDEATYFAVRVPGGYDASRPAGSRVAAAQASNNPGRVRGPRSHLENLAGEPRHAWRARSTWMILVKLARDRRRTRRARLMVMIDGNLATVCRGTWWATLMSRPGRSAAALPSRR